MASCSFREFLFSEICQKLSKIEVRDLAYSQDLPPDYLGKDGTEVLLKLESLDKFSESNLSPLASMMKTIGRNALGRKANSWQKAKKKELKLSNKKPAQNDHMLKQCQITSSSEMSKHLLKITSDQFEEIQTAATEIGNRRVAEDAASAITIIEQQLLGKLSLISAHLARDSMRHSQISTSSVSSGSSAESTEADPSPLLSRVSHQVENPEDPSYDYITVEQHRPFKPQLYVRRSEEDNHDKGQLVTGRDGPPPTKPRPPVAPKPKLKPRSGSLNQDPVPSSEESCTGDSGFEDATKFRKDVPPKTKPKRPRYQPIQVDTREQVCYYAVTAKTIGNDSDDIYDELVSPDPEGQEPIYANFPPERRKQ